MPGRCCLSPGRSPPNTSTACCAPGASWEVRRSPSPASSSLQVFLLASGRWPWLRLTITWPEAADLKRSNLQHRWSASPNTPGTCLTFGLSIPRDGLGQRLSFPEIRPVPLLPSQKPQNFPHPLEDGQLRSLCVPLWPRPSQGRKFVPKIFPSIDLFLLFETYLAWCRSQGL